MTETWCVMCGCLSPVVRWKEHGAIVEEMNVHGHLPAGRIPMCCWPSNTKLPIGWPSGLYAAPWLTEGSRRKPDCSQSWSQRKREKKTYQTISNCSSLNTETLHTISWACHVQNGHISVHRLCDEDYRVKVLQNLQDKDVCSDLWVWKHLCYLPLIQNSADN